MAVEEEKEHSSITYTETVHRGICVPESSGDTENHIKFKHYFHGQLFTRTEHVVRGSHYKSEIVLTLPRGWQKNWKYIRVYQLCNCDHSMIYRNGQNKILRKWHFYNFDRDSELLDGYVVDNGYDYREGKLFYAEIDEEGYRKKGCFQFTDGPCGTWICMIHGIFLLEEINKKQDFRDYVVAVEENGNEIPLTCLKWSYRFIVKRNQRPEHIRYEAVEVDLTEYPFPSDGIMKLPSANDRQFLFQYPNPSLGIPEEVIIYPRVLPPGYNNEKFEKEIIRQFALPPGTYNSL